METRRHSNWLTTQGRLGSSNVGREVSAEQALDFVEAHRMVLAATRSDLDRAHQRCESAGLRPVEARGKTIEKTGAIRIAATGGIHHFGCLNARDLDPLPAGVDDGPLCASGENECLELLRHFLELAPG